MKDEELGSTKPIKIEKEDSISREEKYEDILEEVGSREEKYEDILEEEVGSREEKYQKIQEEEKKKEAEEEAEKALAQKNIELAEEYEALEEQEELGKDLEESEEINGEEKGKNKKEKPLVRFKNWWKSLEKGQRWLYGIIGILFFLLFVLLIVGLVAVLHKEKPKEEKGQEEQTIAEEQAPIMFDNYYYKDGTLVFLTEGGAEIGSYTCENKDEKLCSVATNNYRDVLDVPRVVDESGNDVIEYVGIVDEDYVFVNDTDSEGTKNIILYSIKKQEKIANYHDVKAYDGGYYVVSNTNNEYGLIQIDKEVKELIKHQYSYLGMIDNESYLVAKESKGFILINKKDNGVSKHINTAEVKYYNNNFIVTKDEGTYSVYNLKGKELESGYTFATVRNKYIFLVDNKEVFVRDADGTKYNEKGVELKNFEYIKSFIYNDNDELAKTKRSFDIEVKGDNIAIAVYDVDYDNPQFSNLNINEANLNKKFNNLNYFEDTFYFYKDEDKKELIGSYQCEKKNEIGSKTTEYSECFVAKDTIFEDNDSTTERILNRKTTIPLMNNKYIFMSDGDNNIVLFDLQAGVKKSSYSKVNSYYENNDYKFNLAEGKFNIVALNKKGKYGVIRIDGSNVSSLHSFKYNKIELLYNQFIAEDTNGKWLILDGKNTTGIYPGKVAGFTKDFKYVKAGSGGKYGVYKADGSQVGDKTYYYVELFGSEFAGVDSSRNVVIYDYTGKQLTEEKVVIPSGVSLMRTDNVAVKVNKSGENYIISVYDGSKYVDHTVPIIKEKPETPEEPENGEQN